MQILVVTDGAPDAALLTELDAAGAKVVVVISGTAAQTALKRSSFDAVFCDAMLPDTADLRRRAHAQNEAVYFCLLTPHFHATECLSLLEQHGADNLLVVPAQADEIRARLRVASRLSTLQETLRSQQNALSERNSHLSDMIDYMSAASRRFAELFEGLPVACYSLDGDGNVYEWNRAAASLFGYASHETLSCSVWNLLFAPEDVDGKAEQHLLLARAMAGETLPEWEWQARTQDGQTRRLLSRALPTRGRDNTITGVICAHMDITERDALKRDLQAQTAALAEANARLAEMVTLDGLTGLKNRRFLNEALEKAHSFAARHHLPLSLIMLDVDHFKSYNDAFGHPEGDAVLRMTGQLLRDSTRDHDICARYGGEEFCVLLPATDARGAVRVAERLRSALEACKELRRPVTASVGVSTLSLATPGADGLLQEADQALYRSKAGGRNRVTHVLDPVLAPAA